MTARKLKYLFIHTTATRPDRADDFDAQTLIKMHCSPKPQGRGWKQVGYAKLILTSGKVATFVTNDGDGLVDASEVTNGVRGFNSISRHICYVGGLDQQGRAKNTLNKAQQVQLMSEIEDVLAENPDVFIVGHNQVSNKACPCFSVPSFLIDCYAKQTIKGLKISNIYLRDDYGHAQKWM